MKEIIASFENYNERRYSLPWVCKMTENGKYDFSNNEGIGTYTGRKGEAGDLVIFNPEVGMVYGWGQKDYRGNNTAVYYRKWDGEKFIKCDKLGR